MKNNIPKDSIVYDVIVAGGGPSGFACALSSARNGAKTLLIEKNGFLGGMNTSALVGPLMTFHSGDEQIVKGIAQEIVDRLIKKGGSIGHIPDPIGVASTITPIEPEILKHLYFEMAAEEKNLTIMLHTYLSGVEVTGNMISSVVGVNKSGSTAYFGKNFVDATGDGDLAAMAKQPFEEGRVGDGFSQPMTLMFKMGGVDTDILRNYIKENPEQFILNIQADIDKYIAVSGFFDLVDKAKSNGDFTVCRDRVLMFEGVNKGEFFINMSRVIKCKGTDATELTAAEIEAHRQVDEIIQFMKSYIPGFSNSYLLQSGANIGVRESRRFSCQYTLTLQDVLEGKDFEDSIACCGFPVDIHDPLGSELTWIRKNPLNYCTIPYRCLVPKKILNLLITGRCISGSHEAMASARVTPTAMAIGEASGLAAAIATKDGCIFKELNISVLQKKLIEQGAVIRREAPTENQ